MIFRIIVPYLAWAYVSLVGLTSRLSIIGQEHLDAARRVKGRVIYAFWHQRQIYFTWSHRGSPVSVLVSRSKDGELIAKTMELSRIAACRGSSSRGAAAAAREMMRALEQGLDVGISPDGPKGPARRVKQGILYLAQKTGLPIVPITNAVSLKLVFSRSWDRFQVPLPFSRAVLAYGEPIRVDPQDSLDAKALEVEKGLNLITEQADQEVGS